MAEGTAFAEARGFGGSVSNLLLSDVLQLEGQNRFSGAVSVTWDGRKGRLFFQSGEIVHAESEGLEGEAAVVTMLGWPGGGFSIEANVSTVARTISKRLSHLLLDVHAAIDHARAGIGPGAPDASGQPEPPEENPMTITEAVRALPDVSYAVSLSPEGTPVGDVSPQAESLAAKGIFLATLMGTPVGAAFGLGELKVAALHAGREPLLLVRTREHFLCASLLPGGSLEETETAIRDLLARA
jgi:hypothetical protein